MKNLKRDVRGELIWGRVILVATVLVLIFSGMTWLTIEYQTRPMEIRITNTSAEPLPVEIYIDGAFYISDTIEPKQVETYEYKNGFWGPGNTLVVVKLPNTLFEKEGCRGETISFVFE